MKKIMLGNKIVVANERQSASQKLQQVVFAKKFRSHQMLWSSFGMNVYGKSGGNALQFFSPSLSNYRKYDNPHLITDCGSYAVEA